VPLCRHGIVQTHSLVAIPDHACGISGMTTGAI
jgi:hypothetical protein